VLTYLFYDGFEVVAKKDGFSWVVWRQEVTQVLDDNVSVVICLHTHTEPLTCEHDVNDCEFLGRLNYNTRNISVVQQQTFTRLLWLSLKSLLLLRWLGKSRSPR